MTADVPQLRSRIPRVRTLVVLTLIVGTIALLLTVVLPHQRQMAAIGQIEAVHGSVFTEPVGPVWLREWLGEDRMRGFDRVVGLTKIEMRTLSSSNIADDGLLAIAVFSKLKTLDVSNSQITDAGLSHLEGLTDLEEVSFDRNPITDSGLQAIAQSKSLKRLFLNNTNITDAGLKHLQGVSNLELISLNNTQVTRDGVRDLQIALPKCVIQSDFAETPYESRVQPVRVISPAGRVCFSDYLPSPRPLSSYVSSSEELTF